MLDWRGLVAEATGANIFFVMDGELHTPDAGLLPGRDHPADGDSLARRKQMKVVERQIDPVRNLARATEVFLAGTAAEVTAVREIGAQRFTPGPITETLMKDYDGLVLSPPEEVARVVG